MGPNPKFCQPCMPGKPHNLCKCKCQITPCLQQCSMDPNLLSQPTKAAANHAGRRVLACTGQDRLRRDLLLGSAGGRVAGRIFARTDLTCMDRMWVCGIGWVCCCMSRRLFCLFNLAGSRFRSNCNPTRRGGNLMTILRSFSFGAE